MSLVKLAECLIFTGAVLLALALMLGGCRGNKAQDWQQDVQEEQEHMQ